MDEGTPLIKEVSSSFPPPYLLGDTHISTYRLRPDKKMHMD